MKKIAIIGGGPASLMLAANLDSAKYQVTLFEKKKAIGRKFLVAGEGGLNLSFKAEVKNLIHKYHPSSFIAPIINTFSNTDLINWFDSINVPTFVGTSNRIFPSADLKPIEVLKKIEARLIENNSIIKLQKEWTGWNEDGLITIDGKTTDPFDIIIFALGGASWKVTGSDGRWKTLFEKRGIEVKSFRAANCAFKVDWNTNFINTHQGKPLKNISVSYEAETAKGELCITKFGLEGNAIYALSQKIQDTFLTGKTPVIQLDLKPTMTVDQIKTKLKNSKLKKITDILKQDVNLDRASIGLIKQFSDKETFLNLDLLAEFIKSIPITLVGTDDLDKAISSLGGIALTEIDESFQLHKIPDTYVIGEMLDWFAPTGGYLLQACFSMGWVLAQNLNNTK